MSADTSTADHSRKNAPRLVARGTGRSSLVAGALFFFLCMLSIPCALRASEPLDQVLASVNQSLITRRDLLMHAVDLRLREGTLWHVPLHEMEEELLPLIIEETALYHHFFRVTQEPAEEELVRQVEAEWVRYVRRMGSPERLRQALVHEGVRPAELRGWLKERARRREVVNRGLVRDMDPALLHRADDTPADAERYLLGEIFLRPMHDSTEAWTETAERAARIRLRLEEGMDFEEAARIFSDDDELRRQGGRLGWVEREHLNESVRDAVVGLGTGGVSPPVRSPSGFHVFRVEDYETPARREAWEEYQAVRTCVLEQALEGAEITSPSLPQPSAPGPPDREVWEVEPRLSDLQVGERPKSR